MNQKSKKILGVLGILVILAVIGYVIFKKKVGVINVPSTVSEEEQASGADVSYLKVPAGFKATIYAEGVPGARVMEFDSKGRMLVSQTKEGKIAVIENSVPRTLVSDLKNPHGLAFRCEGKGCQLYVAESNALTRFDYDAATGTVSNKIKLMNIGYSKTNRHYTRTLLFLPSPQENTLLISVGSTCDACDELDPDNAAIISYNIKTKEKEIYAKGLRNSVFMTLDPLSGKVFATEMGRDTLGDDIPPDEINIIEKGKNYGWPICYGQNVHDDKYDTSDYIRNPCTESSAVPAFVDLQAHSAPLGLSFIPEEGWPESYWYNLIVAYHGSWNRSDATGYKLVRIKMNAEGKYLGTEDFITGWLTADGKKHGRPVDVKVMPGGTSYISDDLTGVIYKVARN